MGMGRKEFYGAMYTMFVCIQYWSVIVCAFYFYHHHDLTLFQVVSFPNHCNTSKR